MNGLIDVLRLLDQVTKSMLQDKLINPLPLLYLSRQLWGKEGGLPCPFVKFEKRALTLAKKGPNSVHLWITYSIQNVVLRVSRRKNFKIFLRGFFFLCFIQIFCRSALIPQNLPCPKKFLVVLLTVPCLERKNLSCTYQSYQDHKRVTSLVFIFHIFPMPIKSGRTTTASKLSHP